VTHCDTLTYMSMAERCIAIQTVLVHVHSMEQHSSYLLQNYIWSRLSQQCWDVSVTGQVVPGVVRCHWAGSSDVVKFHWAGSSDVVRCHWAGSSDVVKCYNAFIFTVKSHYSWSA
jgi:hypothetical protein